MRILQIENPAMLAKAKAAAKANILFAAKDAQEVYLRCQFDISCVESTALATIEVTEQLGYTDLAEEMRNDFYCETGREAV